MRNCRLREAKRLNTASRMKSRGKRANKKSKAKPEARSTSSFLTESRATLLASSHKLNPPKRHIKVAEAQARREVSFISFIGWNHKPRLHPVIRSLRHNYLLSKGISLPLG